MNLSYYLSLNEEKKSRKVRFLLYFYIVVYYKFFIYCGEIKLCIIYERVLI